VIDNKMELDKETQEKIQELQSYEQGLHSILIQKQAFQMELNETENALDEITDSVFSNFYFLPFFII